MKTQRKTIEKQKKETWVNEKNQRKTKGIGEKQMKTKRKTKKSENNMKNYWEPKKNLWTNQEKTMRTIEKQMKNQRRNNEKQWKTKDNYASILNYFFAFFFFRSCFFKFSIFNGGKK